MFFWVVNWDRYNKKRKDVIHPSCFALSHNFLEDEKVLELNHTETCFFIYCLCRARKANSGIIAVPLTHCKSIGKFNDEQIEQCSKRLSVLGLIKPLTERDYIRHVASTSRARNGHVTDTGDDPGGTPFPSHSPILNSSTKSSSSFYNSSSLKKSSDEEFLLEPQEGRVVVPEFKAIEKILVSREVSLKVQMNWLETYPDPKWIVSEIKKMIAWEEVNTKKQRFGRFANNWLSRGWDKRPSAGNKPKHDFSYLKD